MTATPRKPKPWWLGAIFVVIGIAILLGLGTWQLQRLRWKESLLAHVAALRTAPAQPLDEALASGKALEFTRVSFDCPGLLDGPQVRLYSLDGAGQIAYRLMTACPVAAKSGASILVDLGVQDCGGAKPEPPFSGSLTGILRKPDAKTFVTPPNKPADKLWYWRDLDGMAKALKVDAGLPVYVALEHGPQPAGGCRFARSPIPADIPNRHLEYALTWYGLAAALAGVYIALLLRRRPSKT